MKCQIETHTIQPVSELAKQDRMYRIKPPIEDDDISD